MVERGHESTVFTTNSGSEEAIFSYKGNIVRKNIEIIDGVKVLRHKVIMRFPYFLKSIIDKNRFLYTSKEVSDYVEGIRQRKKLNFMSRILNVKPPISFSLYKNLVLSEGFDIFYIDTISLNHALYAYKVAKKKGIPLVVWPNFHSTDKLYYSPINIKILREADAVIVYTNAEKDIFMKLGIKSDKIYVTGAGIKLEDYERVDEELIEDLKSKYSLNEYKGNILFLSRLQKEKGVFKVIEAIIEINKTSASKLQLLIAGPDYGRNAKAIRDVSSRFNFVKYIGPFYGKKKVALLHSCDILVVPSIVDAFGIVYLEAWACNKPIIGADIPSTRELISYGKDGFYVKYNDINGLRERIEFLLDNPARRREMGKAGYIKVYQNYTEDIMFEKVYNIFCNVINN